MLFATRQPHKEERLLPVGKQRYVLQLKELKELFVLLPWTDKRQV